MAVIQKFRCRVEKIIDFGEHVYQVHLRPERPLSRFRPGQFLHLALDSYDPSGFWPESRVFSIASSPGERELLSIAYSVRGRFTARMERELCEGGWVWVKLPYGDFVIHGDSDVVLFAGGTGITAFTAFLRKLTPEFSHRVYLAYGARRRSLLIYRDLLQELRAMVPQLQVFYFVERPESSPEDRGEETIGCLSVEAVWPKIGDPLRAKHYLSGPPQMLEAISQDLRQWGMPAESIRIDAWD